MEAIEKLIWLLDSAIKEDAVNSLTSWGIIKSWYDKEIDETRNIIDNAKDWLVDYQNKLSEETWIVKLKIKHTNVFGYFIEVPLASKDNVPEYFAHKQTLVSAARFVTPELKDFEKKVVEWEGLLVKREYDVYLEIRDKILWHFEDIKDLSQKTWNIDMLCSLASKSASNDYTRPLISKKFDLSIKSGRHPVIEKIEPDFISNDLDLSSKSHLHIITGPNMGWKSTFLRQNALIILMAHIWCYVPAREAMIPLTDKIFSRIGASDNLFLGQSTFMVEMQEMANILHNYTDRSFVIIDEIGRGTSTYDWMSIAWAVLKDLHDRKWVKTLFATHYHELLDESKILPWVESFSVAVWENQDWIIFLRKIIKWWIKKSYGLEVAKLWWMGESVLSEARAMLLKLEDMHNSNAWVQLSIWNIWKKEEPIVKYVEVKWESEIENALKWIDVNNLTPIDALNLINNLKKSLK